MNLKTPIQIETELTQQDEKWNWRMYKCVGYFIAQGQHLMALQRAKPVKGERIYAKRT